jgi:hypothetical protein
MKKIFVSILFISLVSVLFKYTYNDKKTEKASLQLSKVKERKKYDQPDKAVAWLEQFRQTPKNSLSPSQLNRKIQSEVKAIEKTRKTKKAQSPNIPKFKFENLGPSNFGGRIRGFVINPDDENQLLAGSVSGGIWKSINAGKSWKAKGDFLSTIAIGSMIVDPDNSKRVYVGTGEGFFNFDAARGAGIFVSEDFGESWDFLSSTNTDDFLYVNRLVRIPNSSTLIAATFSGIFKSDDLGQTWSEVSGFATAGRGFVDLKIDPSDSNHLLAVHYGIPNDALNFVISSPSNIANNYEAVVASFGPSFPEEGINNLDVVIVNDTTAPTNDGCEAITNDLTDKIALIQRGSCNFTDKVKNAQLKGALAVIVYQNSDDSPFGMGGDDDTINIPSAMISKANGELIVNESTTVIGSVLNVVASSIDRLLLRSTNAGISWENLGASQGLPEINVGRMELAFGMDGVIYVAVANSDDATLGLWRSPGGVADFVKTQTTAQFIERQGWYDLAIGVHPNDSNTVFTGAVDQFVTRDGGDSMIKNSNWRPSGTATGINSISKYMHSDLHGFIFSPNNPDHHYIVGDGGVFKTEDNGLTFNSLNDGLSISQSYGIAVSPDGTKVTSGTQDNGSQLYFGDTNNWFEWSGGDGGYSAWDQQNGNYLYGSFPNGGMFGSKNSGQSIRGMELPDTDGASFIQPFALDAKNGNRLIVGTNNVFYTSNARSLNNATFLDITGDLASGNVNALSFNSSIENQILIGMTGGNIYKLDSLGDANTLTDITPSDNGDFRGAITDVKSDASDVTGNTLYATRGNYEKDRVIKSLDGGQTWQSIAGNLPEMPVYQITIDPKNPNILIIGTEVGLWVAELEGTSTVDWQRYDYGLAFTRVMDFDWYEDDTLFIGTHGRGTYKASRNPIDISLNTLITTNSSIDNDGILDSGETGLYMVNVKNNSGFDISGAQLEVSLPAEFQVTTSEFDIDKLLANSSTVIPVEVTLNDDSSCLLDTSLSAVLNYEDKEIIESINIITSANINLETSDFFDGAEESSSEMTIERMLGSSDWQQVDSAFRSGSKSWFASNEISYADKSLISPWMVMNGGGNMMSFSLKYSTQGDQEQYFDGVILELREKGGLWEDIGHLSSIAYDGQLFNNNTALTRQAWSGSQNNWRDSIVDLADLYQGKTVQFRFRMVSDTRIGGVGFWVDDIQMSNVIRKTQPSCDPDINSGNNLPSSGLWYDRSKSGHGFGIEPIGRDNLYFIIFYTYDDNGIPEWYTSITTLENGVLNVNFETDTLQKSIYNKDTQSSSIDPSLNDGRLSIDFNSSEASSNALCNDGTAGRQMDRVAILRWKLDDQQGSWCIEPIISEDRKGSPDFGGTWYGGSGDSGWGLSLSLVKTELVSIFYYYDDTGQPRWAIGQQQGFERGNDLKINMNEVSGFGRLETPIAISTNSAGTIIFNLENSLNNILIDGKISIDVNYQGVEGGDWIRNSSPIQILTKPH